MSKKKKKKNNTERKKEIMNENDESWEKRGSIRNIREYKFFFF